MTWSQMSYVSQNFSPYPQITILTQRLKLTFLARNIKLIITLTKHKLSTWFLYTFKKTDSIYYLEIYKLLFVDYLELVLFTINKTTHAIHTHNITKSLQYWVLTGATMFIENNYKLKELMPITDRYIQNQYHMPINMSNISLHNKSYRKVLIFFMQNLLVDWNVWSKHYRISFQFLIGNESLYLLRFYNLYFFKLINF